MQLGSRKFAVLGEVMIELAALSEHSMSIGVAGDTFNTAAALSRLGMTSEYITALGTDVYSDRIRRAVEAHGVRGVHIATLPDALPGIYAISTDSSGERSFAYWRDNSAARQWFADPIALLAALQHLDDSHCIYWSGITLALMMPEVRAAFFDFLRGFRADGGMVCFDSNYRPQLWRGSDQIADSYDAAIGNADLYLPSLEDELSIYQRHSEQQAITALAKRYSQKQAQVVMTLPGQAVWISAGDIARYDLPVSDAVADTTGAGDAFSGALLAALGSGRAMPDAIPFAHRVATEVVQVSGAILPEQKWSELAKLLGGHHV